MTKSSENLRVEVAHLDIQVVLTEPVHWRPNFLSAGCLVKAAMSLMMDPLRGISNAHDQQ